MTSSAPAVPSSALGLLFVRALRLLLPVREIAGQNNRGRFVEAILASVGLAPGQPWCMALLSYVGKGLLAERWALPATGSCDVVLEFARAQGRVLPAPVVGCVGLRLRREWDADHAFVVTALEPHGAVATLEGNTTGGSRDGQGVQTWRRGGPTDAARYVWVWPFVDAS